MALSQELLEQITRLIDERVKDIKVQREDFGALREAVHELVQAQARTDESVRALVEAQARTEEAVRALAEAQARTDERVARLEAAVERLSQAQARTEEAVRALAEAQARTDERVTRLEAAVERLSQAQARTEEAVRALAEAQARTDERVTRLEAAVERLSHAQANTQQALKELSEAVTTLAKSVEILSQQVGKLSDTVGFGLEDVARVVLPGYLWRHFGIDLKQELDRRFILVDKAEVEINLYGEGKLGDQDVVVIGECKSRIYHREVERFLQTLDLLANRFDKKVIKVMFGFYIHPSAQRLAEANEIILVASYQR